MSGATKLQAAARGAIKNPDIPSTRNSMMISIRNQLISNRSTTK
jgi:hypothetical protein